MNIIFEINHPKHYYQFKYIAEYFSKKHNVTYLARNKEIVFKILEEEKAPYVNFGKHYKSLIGKVFGSISIYLNYYKIVKKLNPDIIISKASLYSTALFYKTRVKTVIFPDSEIVVLTNNFVSKVADVIITPNCFTRSFGKKQFTVNGLFEETYLDKSVFKPNIQIKKTLDKTGRGYAILRFVSWNANHDVGKSAVSIDLISKIVKTIEEYKDVYITSEAKLPQNLKKYTLPIPKNEIHSALYYADLYVGDSQSMATESALLGVPAIRCNSFVGEHDMNVFKVLENKYKMLNNFSDWEQALNKVIEICKDPESKSKARKNSDNYYSSKKDINKEIIDIIEGIK